MQSKKVAIVGGGVAGASTALFLGSMGLEVVLFERERDLVNGPPFCHLHAGGNLYPDISDEQCVTLLRQSIDFAKTFPQSIDYRPTVIALPSYGCNLKVNDLLPRLKKLQHAYRTMIQEDPTNQCLGESSAYFQTYSREKLLALRERPLPDTPTTHDEWMIPLAKYLDFDHVQFPLILVQEYGINLFHCSASLSLALQALPNVTLHFQSPVTNITLDQGKWNVHYQHNQTPQHEEVDYLINAAGFRTGTIDEMLGVECTKMVEFKAAYITQWEKGTTTPFPEVIFHGKRGTPQGMGQFTPYPEGYFQLHGMTPKITLYPDGLVKNSPHRCQPQLPSKFLEKIELGWHQEEIKTRTHHAIEHLARFIPSFKNAHVGSKPLFGAQQIPGDDPSLRVAEVAFPRPHYARCEIVKVSSVIDMIQAIIKDLKEHQLLDAHATLPPIALHHPPELLEADAIKLATHRGYPKGLGQIGRRYP